MSSQSRKHLLILASYAPSLLNFRGPLIRDVIAAGNCVSVGAPDITPDIRVRLEMLGAKVHETALQRTGTGILADLRYGLVLLRLIYRIHPDVVLTYTIKPNIWGAFASTCAGVPSVAMVTGLGYVFTDSGVNSFKQRLIRFVARFLYRSATNCNTRVIFQNPDDRDDFCKAGCLSDVSKIGMVDGSGVDMTHYMRVPLPDKPVFLMIARLLRNKGVREYAEASISILQQYPQARCILVGPFDEGPDGVSKTDLDHWIAGGLEYLGPQVDVRLALSQARIYVLPSYREGTPRSVLEAMAMGRPIITTDAPGCRETVVDGDNGFLVPVRAVDELVAAMEKFVLFPELVERMGKRSREIAEAKYDVNAVNAVMLREMGIIGPGQ